jgi:hypothetical protein
MQVHARHSEGRSILNQPLAICAAKVSKEPEREVLNSCCARSQRQKCRMSEEFGAAMPL